MAAPTEITSPETLHGLYGEPSENAVYKELDRLIPEYRVFIEASPFLTIASAGPDGLDCTPRGDAPGFVRIVDDRTLMIPDRRGNNRVDTLGNILHDPRVGLLFLIPGCGETIRVNGRARISVDPELLASFVVEGQAPRSVLVVEIDRVYFQCAKAIMRSQLWDPSRHVERNSLPSPGRILKACTAGRMDAEAIDQAYPGRLKATLW
ncbi:pyridoxamine 5'-phosphate oxidase family protein [Enterovirga sp. CN4-39]|uniref:pyridoxamine 5'-phosphate oxidase family protein n=1 Tax=Enterovirga sp. CN4-39 TaxID=3400910 RepID=UPI003C02D432